MSSSKRRIAASRANGRKSKGPVTPEGKARSAANSTRHGLASPHVTAKSVCLSTESRALFDQLHQALIDEHNPASASEALLVEELAPSAAGACSGTGPAKPRSPTSG